MAAVTDKPVLVTGAAGFIGFHVARRLLEAGRAVVGVDNLNAYYDPALKEARLAELAKSSRLPFHQARSGRPRRHGRAVCRAQVSPCRPSRGAGRRALFAASIRTPMSMPTCRASSTSSKAAATTAAGIWSYASSSSVYGANTRLPFSTHRQCRSSAQPLRRDQEGQRTDGAFLFPSVQAADHGTALLHGLWPVGPAGHGDVDFRQGDRRRESRSSCSITARCGATSPMSTTWWNRSCG